ncbi:MAG: hypothetical protein AAF351_15625 [Pseudomonadota bacterium]
MWIVFGWDKEISPVGEVAEWYCYDCRKTTEWIVWNESEWVTFSDIRTLRFVNKHTLHCDNCTLEFALESREFQKINRHMKRNDSINDTKFGDALMKRIEAEQLDGKTPLQRKYIQESMDAIQEYEDKIREQEKRFSDDD